MMQYRTVLHLDKAREEKKHSAGMYHLLFFYRVTPCSATG